MANQDHIKKRESVNETNQCGIQFESRCQACGAAPFS